MRFVSFNHEGATALGLCQDESVRALTGVDPSASLEVFSDLVGAVQRRPGPVLDRGTLALRPPVPNPGKIICIGLNYVDHAKEGGHAIPEYPAVFLRTRTSLSAPDAPMVLPPSSEKLDYEAELAIVIGRGGSRISEADALRHVAGYSCFNDGSLRDYQRKSSQWTMGKNFDSTGGFGPELVTPDEVAPGAHGLRITSRLNGKVMQDGNTADMIFSVARIIAIASEVMTLEPGDVIATGTPAGVGYARKPPVFMKSGDVCEVEIEGIGTLRNPIRAG